MKKLNMQSRNLANENYEKLKELFPNAITEAIDENGNIVRAIDKDILTQEISTTVVSENQERYQFTWPDKRQAILASNAPTSNTLRPSREESVNFDDTENLYIEGDNLEVLKQLQETYLGKVKMIYIDPPYNTGNDFVYNDDFKKSTNEYLEKNGQYDEEGNRLEKNLESNGRFHTDWLNMMYPRLKLARNLLSDDGVIFISIDDNEQANLKKICDEIFGETNFESCIKWRRRSNQPNDMTKMIAKVSEYILVYAKDSSILKVNKAFGTVDLNKSRKNAYSNIDNDPKGEWSTTPWAASKGQGGSTYTIKTPTGICYEETWLGTEETFNKHLIEGRIYWPNNGNGKPRKKIYLSEAIEKGQSAIDYWYGDKYGDNLEATNNLKNLFKNDRIFDYSKPLKLLKTTICIGCPKEGIILDFFSGSSSTANAVMQLNAEDGGNRKFIMVQLPEETDKKSEAYKAGYKNICEIGKERIRRAGKKILEENKDKEGIENLDIGFRVLKVDSSNMKDVYYSPEDTNQNLLDMLSDNVKEDRTSEDLLFQAMLDLGIDLSSKIAREEIDGKEIFVVDDGFLVACFDKDLTEEIVKTIAKKEPHYSVFRDSSMANDSVAVNFEQIFVSISPQTIRRVI